jgi:hypothetical protein
MNGQHVGMAEQLGMFFPKVASKARARKVEETKKIKNERAKVAQKAGQAKAVMAPAPAPAKKAVSADGVVCRDLLWADGLALFSVKIPRDAEYKVGVNGGDDYLRFFRPVKGGVVNIHVYHPDNHPDQFVGGKVVCDAEVWMKRYEDGREYLYLNLFILPRETEVGCLPTHEWRVVQGRDPFMPKGMKNVHHFPTPEPLDGAIVVGNRIPKFQ